MNDNCTNLSIICPVYNVAGWLSDCIDSVLHQSYQCWELILVNDGSTDGSSDICDEYAARDSRISVIHKANGGISTARNAGLDAARGKYIAFIDADDCLYNPETLALNIAVLDKHPGVSIVQFPHKSEHFDQADNISRRTIDDKGEMLKSLHGFEITGFIWDKIFRAEIIGDTRMPEGIALAEDTWFLLEMLPRVKSLHISGLGLYRYNVRTGSAMRSFNAKKCADLFGMSCVFMHRMGEYLPKTDPTRIAYFYQTYQRYLDAQIATHRGIGKYCAIGGGGNLQIINLLKQSIPSLSHLFSKTLSTKNKIWLLLIKFLGLKIPTKAYVEFVLRRTKSKL